MGAKVSGSPLVQKNGEKILQMCLRQEKAAERAVPSQKKRKKMRGKQ